MGVSLGSSESVPGPVRHFTDSKSGTGLLSVSNVPEGQTRELRLRLLFFGSG